jgi:hypothetical protein
MQSVAKIYRDILHVGNQPGRRASPSPKLSDDLVIPVLELLPGGSWIEAKSLILSQVQGFFGELCYRRAK